jgi:MFS family permease
MNKRMFPLVLVATTIRSAAIGALSILFGLYLGSRGFDEVQIGVLIAAGLAGMAVGTGAAGFLADRFGRRKSLVLISVIMACGAGMLAVAESFLPVFLASFIGMVNGMGRDRGPAQAIDQAIIAQSVPAERRTTAFSRYTFLQDIGTGIGSLLAGFSSSNHHPTAILLYAGAVLVSALFYPVMTSAVEATRSEDRGVLLPESKKLIVRFAGLSMLDSLGGGFVTRALLTYWFIQRFGVDATWIGILFGASSFINALSYFVAAWLARRVGLVNTMVFTHIPSNLFLIAVPFAPSFPIAMVLFFLREFLSPMDLPTRQSYLSAIVADHERTAAAGIVNMARNTSWVVGPTLAGWAMTFSFAAPLFMGGTIKIIYDLLLWASFRSVKPPEEAASP